MNNTTRTLRHLLPALFLAGSLTSADAATLTIDGAPYRYFYQSTWADDTIGNPSTQTYGPFTSTGTEPFMHEVTHSPSVGMADAQTDGRHNSTIVRTPTSLDIVGDLRATAAGNTTDGGYHFGNAQWTVRAQLDITFTIDEPFHYMLTANTSGDNDLPPSRASFVALGRLGTFHSPGPSNPDIAAFGESLGSAGSNAWGFTAPTDSGTVSGTLAPGTYEFHAIVYEYYYIGRPNVENYSANRVANFSLSISPAGVFGDVDRDGDVDVDDIDALTSAFDTADEQADLDGSGVVDGADLDLLIRNALGTNYGDANLDKRVNITDLSIVATQFGAADTGWAQGNFNGRDGTNITDLSLLATYFGFDGAAMTAPASSDAVPAPPACVAVLLWGALTAGRWKRAGRVE